MKQSFYFLLLLFIAASSANAQHTGRKAKFQDPLRMENPLRSIIISGNIDVLLSETDPSKTGVRMRAEDRDKLDVSLQGETVILSAAGNLKADERISVFVSVSELQHLELRGKVVVNSRGIVDGSQLHIISGTEGIIALRSNRMVTMSGPAAYEVKKQNGFYNVFAASNL